MTKYSNIQSHSNSKVYNTYHFELWVPYLHELPPDFSGFHIFNISRRSAFIIFLLIFGVKNVKKFCVKNAKILVLENKIYFQNCNHFQSFFPEICNGSKITIWKSNRARQTAQKPGCQACRNS